MQSSIKDNRNKGYSLMELIIIIAIMSILIGGAVLGLSLISQGNVNQACKYLSGELAVLKNNTLSMEGTWYGEVYYDGSSYRFDSYRITTKPKVDSEGNVELDGDGNEIYETVGADSPYSSEVLGSRIFIYYKDSTNAAGKLDLSAGRLRVSFDQSSGEIKKDMLKYNDTDVKGVSSAKGEFTVTTSENGTGNKLTLYYKTGKVSAGE